MRKSRAKIEAAIDVLADAMPNGHLLAASGSTIFLEGAAEHIKELTTALTEARADADFLRRLATQVIAIGTLAPGEELAEPTEHAVIDTALRLRRERDEARARLEKAEAEARRYREALEAAYGFASSVWSSNPLGSAMEQHAQAARLKMHAALTGTRERREGESESLAPAALRVEERALADQRVESTAQLFHETYERLAPAHEWKTQHRSRVPWDRLPGNQRELMRATVAVVLEALAQQEPKATHKSESPPPAPPVPLVEQTVTCVCDDPSYGSGPCLKHTPPSPPRGPDED